MQVPSEADAKRAFSRLRHIDELQHPSELATILAAGGGHA